MNISRVERTACLARPPTKSCRNRHCPAKAAAEDWLADRDTELLGVPYCHMALTLPGDQRTDAPPDRVLREDVEASYLRIGNHEADAFGIKPQTILLPLILAVLSQTGLTPSTLTPMPR
ncbi:MAG: transposase zinc-binding domain-containing protein [Bradyrhizobium sp.]|uniref:transposase zinc-binding domain-containing protein n=1 Tax=Bradyrhizobium sp. TaxID=376 RepID=UPI0018AD51EA|nr:MULTISPECIES: transposase zinc-binding domain-containing protein [Bradyrhizobium]MBJ7402573.1 transposase zinc-binding domain-containing protein [Bradyrhizobium sp.]